MFFKEADYKEFQECLKNLSANGNRMCASLEKDFWVCFALSYLFEESKWKNNIVFKGGTSLSKCFNVIERFSEDIDLILDWRLLGLEKDEPWLERSKSKQEKFNREANALAVSFLKNEFAPEISKGLNDVIGDVLSVSIDAKNPHVVLLKYPKEFGDSYLTQEIRLEIGPLASWAPSKIMSVSPDIQKIIPSFLNGKSMGIRTAAIERTFWEKMVILHHEANRPKNIEMPRRYARHYYDVFCLANSPFKESALASGEMLEKVASFNQRFYPRGWAKYDEARLNSIKLIPDDYRFKEIKKDYQNMMVMFWGKRPKFEEIMDGIAKLEEEIHKTALKPSPVRPLKPRHSF